MLRNTNKKKETENIIELTVDGVTTQYRGVMLSASYDMKGKPTTLLDGKPITENDPRIIRQYRYQDLSSTRDKSMTESDGLQAKAENKQSSPASSSATIRQALQPAPKLIVGKTIMVCGGRIKSSDIESNDFLGVQGNGRSVDVSMADMGIHISISRHQHTAKPTPTLYRSSHARYQPNDERIAPPSKKM